MFGPYKTFFKNGQKETEGSYINGRESGTWNFYNESGKLVKTKTYKNGELISEKNF
jgi:antitoxin component YwqK of YwqJK toxin-antitoxin module